MHEQNHKGSLMWHRGAQKTREINVISKCRVIRYEHCHRGQIIMTDSQPTDRVSPLSPHKLGPTFFFFLSSFFYLRRFFGQRLSQTAALTTDTTVGFIADLFLETSASRCPSSPGGGVRSTGPIYWSVRSEAHDSERWASHTNRHGPWWSTHPWETWRWVCLLVLF